MKQNRMKFLNTVVDNLTMQEALTEMEKLIADGGYHFVVTPNVDHVVILENDPQFQEAYREADLILNDSIPLIWIAKLLKTPIKQRLSGSDIFPALCEIAAQKGYSVFLLGAREGVALEAGRQLQKKFPGLNIAGAYSPKMNFEKDPEELDKIIRIVREANPQILAVGLGAPKQELFISRFKDSLQVPLSLGIGAAIDFEAHNLKRAPVWMQNSGTEWLYRVMKEPRRLFRRYFKDAYSIIGIYLKYRNPKVRE